MVSVQVEILRGLSECFGGKGEDSVFFSKEIKEGSTVGDIIRELATEHQAFSDLILDTQTNQLKGGVSVVLNDLLSNDLGTRIQDGDISDLFPSLWEDNLFSVRSTVRSVIAIVKEVSK